MKIVGKTVQKGFTLVELIIVIVIVGILAAVAIPKLTSTSDQAYIGVQKSTLGALKSAWSLAYAANKSAPTIALLVTQMSDPPCAAATGGVSCTGVTTIDGATPAVFPITTTAAGVIDSPKDIGMPP